ncbi:tyrosine-type recombinase/integrase [Desulfurivibrio sp. C05AmB]|uniref:tyrosine-type recombinase/integrase n=1 Tax=Desulfurivibrio sp. C05AmB TaxID=3374371 RepID=UPI00376EA499
MPNPKGNRTKMEPIRSLEDVKTIKKLLIDRPRDFALFVIGINTAFRASDLLNIKIGQVRHLKPGDDWETVERKTQKRRRITFNNACQKAVAQLLGTREYENDDFLFQGQRGRLTVATVNRLVKGWCQTINLKGNYGSHTLRKSFGYHQYRTFGVPLPDLMEIFNHSTQRQTLEYLCIQDDDIRRIYMTNEL